MSQWQLLLENPIVWLILALALVCYSSMLQLFTLPTSELSTQEKAASWLASLPNLLAALPLLGLLGTIIGLLQTFSELALGGVNLQQLLSGGIADAMLTTQIGLVTVIPGWLMLAALKRKWQQVLDYAQ